ncbi:MAG: DUF4129 domain-containing protein [Acidimicrobiia bacterium]|nr:DUF4129 domain-containing protein [Acidimicrobiia bacterium]
MAVDWVRPQSIRFGCASPCRRVEYRRDIELVVPAAGPDLSELTEVFTEARYSLHVIGPDHVERATAAVRQLGSVLAEHASSSRQEAGTGD